MASVFGQKGQLSGAKHAASMFILYVMLTATFAFVLTPAQMAHASCNGSGVKYNASAIDLDSITDRGNFGYNTPINSYSLCGSSWSDGSYFHLSNIVWTSGTSQYAEVMWYFGYNSDGGSSTTSPAFQWIKYNIFAGGRSQSDISAGTGIYPSWGDQINMTNRYDHTDILGRDYYRFIINDITSGNTITINNVWVDGRGNNHYFQSETFNKVNMMEGTFNTGKYYASSSWTAWASNSLVNSSGSQALCVTSTAINSFDFGAYNSNGVCISP